MRKQGVLDALLNRVLADNGFTEPPLSARRDGELKALAGRARELAPLRDGPVSPEASDLSASEHTRLVKEFALEMGAARVGIARLAPEFVELDAELEHDWVIGLLIREDYANVLGGAGAVELGAHRAYALCAKYATRLAAYIRDELGFAALAHHNGGCQILALPALRQAGLGELGRHGSLINPDLGAFWRPGMVSTTLPLMPDQPISFGVQEYCAKCRLCETACPGGAIAGAGDYVVTGGAKRWLVDIEKCYGFSRLRTEYCHLCVDVCPYIHKHNGDGEKRRVYKEFVTGRKATGFNRPKG